MSVSESIRRAHAELGVEIERFNAWWGPRATAGEAYRLSLVEGGEPGDYARPVERIDVTTVGGATAVADAQAALLRFARRDDQPPGRVERLPGWFRIDGFDRRRIERINRLKDTLRTMIAEAVKPGIQRDRFCQRLFPGTAMLQLYRHLPLTEHAFRPRRVAFTWSPVTVATTRLSVEQAESLLMSRLQSDTRLVTDGVRDAIEIARQRLAHLPSGAVIARRKPVAPHPRVTVFAGDAADDEMLHAHLPLLLPARGALPVEGLRGFDRERRRRIRADRKRISPILEALDLYCLEPPASKPEPS